MINNKNPLEIRFKFYCEKCNYGTSRKCDYGTHILSRKHKLATVITNNDLIIRNKYECENCNKEYTDRSGLWRHSKKCKQLIALEDKAMHDYTNDIISKLIQENQLLIEQNQEIMKLMVNQNNTITEISKSITTTTNNHQTVNGNINNNNKFNINLFLNEKCKDAINFADFIKNIEVSHEDLENNAQLGFANGISKIIMDNLKQLSIYDRPIHCSDVKRETMYIKDDDKWEKEEDTKKLNSAIQEVSKKSLKTLCKWQDTNPDFQDMDSEFSNKCMAMTKQSIAGNNRDVLYPKVIRALAKETMIDKVN